MAYTQINATTPSLTGQTVTLTAPPGAGAGNGDALPAGSTLWVNNASGSSITVTLSIPRTYLGYAITSPTVTVPATTQMLIGPIPADPFGVTTGADVSRVHVDYSSITSVTRAVLNVP
jgi:hypothetical protein